MGKYQNGMETKERILEMCRKMFYEKGYEKTTFKDISEALEINQSAIHYHFRTKENILKIIRTDTGRANNKIVLDYTTDETSCFAKMFLDLRVYIYKIWNDEKYRKFYIDATKNWYTTDTDELVTPSELSWNKYLAMNISDSAFKFMACSAVDHAVLRLVDTKKDDYTMEDIVMQNADMYRRILDIPVVEYVRALKELEPIVDMIDWEGIEINLEGVNEEQRIR